MIPMDIMLYALCVLFAVAVFPAVFPLIAVYVSYMEWVWEKMEGWL